MSEVDVSKARELCEKATPGPWRASSHGTRPDGSDNPDWFVSGIPGGPCSHRTKDDARFIAAARTGWPAALDEVEALRAIIAANLPHPNGPNATTPGDPDAWNAAMFNLGELRSLLATADARVVEQGKSLDEASDYTSELNNRLNTAILQRDEAKRHLDGRIQWQAEAVLHMQTFRALFDTAAAMREGHEGCITDPACGSCFRCDFDRAVDQANAEVAAGVDEFIQESIGFWGRFAAQMQKERDTANRQREEAEAEMERLSLHLHSEMPGESIVDCAIRTMQTLRKIMDGIRIEGRAECDKAVATTQRDTAEQIAAWIELGWAESYEPSESEGADAIRDAATAIRDGSWKQEQGAGDE